MSERRDEAEAGAGAGDLEGVAGEGRGEGAARGLDGQDGLEELEEEDGAAEEDRAEAELLAAVESWDALGWPRPEVAVVSGSGLAVPLGEPERGPLDLAYFVPFEVHPLPGHPHQVELLRPAAGRPVVYFRGRLHPYQGYSAGEAVFPVRLAAQLGARVLILTNATGALRGELAPGTLLAVADHLNLTGLNPLVGQLPAAWGPRFPDMAAAYDPELAALAGRLAGDMGFELGRAIYAGLLGPSYETPAEVRMLRALGGDIAGMSTVLEVIAARQMGVRCLCLSLVSNLAAGLSPVPLSHEDVLAAGAAGGARLQRLLQAVLASPGLI